MARRLLSELQRVLVESYQYRDRDGRKFKTGMNQTGIGHPRCDACGRKCHGSGCRWRERTEDRWFAWFAACFGWMLDAFDFTIFLFIMVPILRIRRLGGGDHGGAHALASLPWNRRLWRSSGVSPRPGLWPPTNVAP